MQHTELGDIPESPTCAQGRLLFMSSETSILITLGEALIAFQAWEKEEVQSSSFMDNYGCFSIQNTSRNEREQSMVVLVGALLPCIGTAQSSGSGCSICADGSEIELTTGSVVWQEPEDTVGIAGKVVRHAPMEGIYSSYRCLPLTSEGFFPIVIQFGTKDVAHVVKHMLGTRREPWLQSWQCNIPNPIQQVQYVLQACLNGVDTMLVI